MKISEVSKGVEEAIGKSPDYQTGRSLANAIVKTVAREVNGFRGAVIKDVTDADAWGNAFCALILNGVRYPISVVVEHRYLGHGKGDQFVFVVEVQTPLSTGADADFMDDVVEALKGASKTLKMGGVQKTRVTMKPWPRMYADVPIVLNDPWGNPDDEDKNAFPYESQILGFGTSFVRGLRQAVANAAKRTEGEDTTANMVEQSTKVSPMSDMVLKKVASLTDRNDHTEANLLVAQTFKYKDYEKLFQAIQMIESVERHQPSEIAKYFYTVHVKMRNRIGHDFGEAEKERVSSNL